MATVVLGRQPAPGEPGQAQAWVVPDDAVDAVHAALCRLLGDPCTDYLVPPSAVRRIAAATADGVLAVDHREEGTP
jgi:hypothetical protein